MYISSRWNRDNNNVRARTITPSLYVYNIITYNTTMGPANGVSSFTWVAANTLFICVYKIILYYITVQSVSRYGWSRRDVFYNDNNNPKKSYPLPTYLYGRQCMLWDFCLSLFTLGATDRWCQTKIHILQRTRVLV